MSVGPLRFEPPHNFLPPESLTPLQQHWTFSSMEAPSAGLNRAQFIGLPKITRWANQIFSLALAQFGTGVFTAGCNFVLLAAVFSSRKLRTADHYLSANVWFSNAVLGVTAAASHAVDRRRLLGAAARPALASDATVAVINSVSVLATLFALNTVRIMRFKLWRWTPGRGWHGAAMQPLSAWSAIKVVVCIWLAVVALVGAKAVYFTLAKVHSALVCHQCFVGFEGALLFMFLLSAVLTYVVSLYSVLSRRGSSVRTAANAGPHWPRELRATVDTGLCLGVFLLGFVALTVVLLQGMAARHQHLAEYASSVTGGPQQDLLHLEDTAARYRSLQIWLLVFGGHAIINPLIAVARDADLRAAVRRVCACRAEPPDDLDQVDQDVALARRRQAAMWRGPPPPAYEARLVQQGDQRNHAAVTVRHMSAPADATLTAV